MSAGRLRQFRPRDCQRLWLEEEEAAGSRATHSTHFRLQDCPLLRHEEEEQPVEEGDLRATRSRQFRLEDQKEEEEEWLR